MKSSAWRFQIAEQRYGAPYWVIHRGDLQAALLPPLRATRHYRQARHARAGLRHSSQRRHRLDARRRRPDRAARHCVSRRRRPLVSHAPALRSRSGRRATPGGSPGAVSFPRARWRLNFANRRSTSGSGAMLIWCTIRSSPAASSTSSSSRRIVGTHRLERARKPCRSHSPACCRGMGASSRALVGLPEAWLKWALHDRRPVRRWTKGPVALLGDAAHPMLPYLAQGAAMAIEDAAVAAQCLARTPDDAPARCKPIARCGEAARGGCSERLRVTTPAITLPASAPGSATADAVVGGKRLLRHYDWIYDWRPPAA